MLKQQKYKKVNHFVRRTADATPEDRARAVARVCKLADEEKANRRGNFCHGLRRNRLLANSKGLLARYDHTEAEFSITILEENSSGWAKASSAECRDIDPDALARERQPQSRRLARTPANLKPGHYTAILEPSADARFCRLAFLRFFRHRRARQALLPERPHGPQSLRRQHHAVGRRVPPAAGRAGVGRRRVPRQKVLLVERGVPKESGLFAASAKKMKTKPTGHGFTLPNEHGEAPTNLVFGGGDKSVAEMIASTERGVLVTRLWYIREVDPYEKTITGMTRDGTFLDRGWQNRRRHSQFPVQSEHYRGAVQRRDDGPVGPGGGRRIVRDGGAGDENPRLSFHRSYEILKIEIWAGAARCLRVAYCAGSA